MTLALIGFGEAGRAFAEGLAPQGQSALAFDPRDMTPAHGVPLVTRAEALAGATAVFCLVTADQARQAAQDCAPHLRPGTLWFDGNSCAPETKRRAAEVIHAAGGDYVDMAIMAPVHPRRHRTPVLLSGPLAQRGCEVLTGWGMQARVVGAEVGQASSVKMIRSVMVKGLEALHAECFLAARKAGVEDEVIGSLIASNPEVDWPVQGAYNLERMMSHGPRRAAEMREVAASLRDLGLVAALTGAAADWQDRIGQMGLKDAKGDLWTRADMILDRL